MTVATFDTLKYANTLKAAGVPDKQAEAQAAVLADALAVNLKDLVTKDDLAATKRDLEQSINLLRADMNGKFALLYWMGGVLMTISVAVLIRLFFIR